ncbi:MAG: tRNA (N6-isopentenyl adenosine(37)-C2)-methylthiotransferase MiaB [bacterium]
MKSKRLFHITTFGCQMNEHDSERMAALLSADGFSWTEDIDKADLVLINSCTIRKKAEEKAFSQAGRLKEFKKHNPRLRIGFCGCVAQREKERIFARLPHIDLVFGTLNIHNISNLVKRLWEKGGKICQVFEDHSSDANQTCSADTNHAPHALRSSPIKAWVTIMEGCNNFCTYCVVPYVRGRERSRSPDDIIKEISFLVGSGRKEVTLLGQNVNSYGKGLNPHMDFAALLYRLSDVPGLERIRFTTSHPKDLSNNLILAMRDCENVCEHIHLPMQSGSDLVLKRMGRGYTVEEYLDKVEAIRKSIPGVAITGDIICGFPGETDKDFEETLRIVEDIRFDGLFTFKYSTRPQTLASRISDQVPEEVKLERLGRLQSLQNQVSNEINISMINKIQQILIEGPSKKDPLKLTGRTRTNKVVNLTGSYDLTGKTVMVRITRAKPFNLEAEVVSEITL